MSEPFWTLSGLKNGGVVKDADHISGLRLTVSKKKGSNLHLDFTCEPEKALQFEDLAAAKQTYNTLSMFMGGPIAYQILKHTPQGVTRG